MNILFSVPKPYTNYFGVIIGFTNDEPGHQIFVTSTEEGNAEIPKGFNIDWFLKNTSAKIVLPDRPGPKYWD